MAGRKNRKSEDDESSSSSDDEVLAKVAKKSGQVKKNGEKSNNKRTSGRAKPRTTKESDDESSAQSTSDESESEAEVKKPKNRNVKQKSTRSNKEESSHSVSRPKRNAETNKDSSKTNRSKRNAKSSQDESDVTDADEQGKSESSPKRLAEKRAAKPVKAKKEKEKAKEIEEEYEVEEILDFKIEDKTKYFLVRWKGYDSSADSWIYRKDLHCTELIQQFYEKHPEAMISTYKRRKKEDYAVGKKKKYTYPPRPPKIDEQPDYDPENLDENQEWKVEKILDVHHRQDKKREFLIRWEGFSSKSDSWEPEENLDCKELIKKFESKLEAITNVTLKELRPYRKPTQRYTVMDATKGRRLSKRLDGRQRAAYYDCEE